MPQSPEQIPDQPQEAETLSSALVEAPTVAAFVETPTDVGVVDAPTDVGVVETPTDVGVVETSGSAPIAAASPKPLDLDPAFCAALIKQQFPALFGDTHKPIKLRIQADIQASLPGVFSKPVLSGFLHRYTGSTPYLIALTRSQQRFDLFGEPAGELAAEHVEAAKLELERRRQLRQQRIEQERAKRPPREQVPARPQGALAGAAQDGVPRQANDRPQQERANDRPQQERANDRSAGRAPGRKAGATSLPDGTNTTHNMRVQIQMPLSAQRAPLAMRHWHPVPGPSQRTDHRSTRVADNPIAARIARRKQDAAQDKAPVPWLITAHALTAVHDPTMTRDPTEARGQPARQSTCHAPRPTTTRATTCAVTLATTHAATFATTRAQHHALRRPTHATATNISPPTPPARPAQSCCATSNRRR